MNPRQAFDMGRAQLGNPCATLVLPITEWTIPETYVVDYTLDEVQDALGATVDLSTIWETVEINILPEARNDRILAMTLAGLTDTGNIAFYIMEEDISNAQTAFRILLDDKEYTVSSVSQEPLGNAQFALVSCALWT